MHSSHLVGPHAAHGRRKCRAAFIYEPVQLLAHVQRQNHRMSYGVDLPTGHDAEKHTWSWNDLRRQGHMAPALHNHTQPRIAIAGVELKYLAKYFIFKASRFKRWKTGDSLQKHNCAASEVGDEKVRDEEWLRGERWGAVSACGADAVSSGWH